MKVFIMGRFLTKKVSPGIAGSCEASFRRQQGAVLLITLISLALLMLSTMALMRSFDTSLSMAGNLAFKRDLTNQAERGMAKAISLVKSGALTSSNLLASNYSAASLPSDAHGLPLALINDLTFSTVGTSTNDINDASAAISVRFVIDRQCNATGVLEVSKYCSFVNIGTDTDPNYQAVYRVSVRANGPRNTQVYLQSNVTD